MLDIILLILTLTFSRIAVIYLHSRYFKLEFRGDAAEHFVLFKHIRKNPNLTNIPQYLIPNKLTYPKTFHRLSSLFSIATIKKFPYLPNLIIYIVFTIIYLSYSAFIFQEIFPNSAKSSLILVIGFFIISASNLNFTGNNILYLGFSERYLSKVSSALFVYTLSIFLILDNNVSFAIAILAGSLAILSSKFGRQLVFFSTGLFCIGFLSLIPLLVTCLSLFIAFLFGRTYFIKSLVHGFIYSIKIYKPYIKKSFHTSKVLSYFVNLSRLWQLVRVGRIRSIFNYLTSREPTRTLYFLPELVLLIILSARSSVEINYYIPVIILLALYLVTSTKAFNHFGESFRYLEFGLYYYIPFLIVLLASNYSNPASILVFYIPISIFHLMRSIRNVNQIAWPSTIQPFLKKYPLNEEDRVYPVSMRLAVELCSYSDCRVLYPQTGGITNASQWEHYIQDYPYLSTSINSLVLEHKISCIVIRKIEMTNLPFTYDFTPFFRDYEDEEYLVYKTNNF